MAPKPLSFRRTTTAAPSRVFACLSDTDGSPAVFANITDHQRTADTNSRVRHTYGESPQTATLIVDGSLPDRRIVRIDGVGEGVWTCRHDRGLWQVTLRFTPAPQARRRALRKALHEDIDQVIQAAEYGIGHCRHLIDRSVAEEAVAVAETPTPVAAPVAAGTLAAVCDDLDPDEDDGIDGDSVAATAPMTPAPKAVVGETPIGAGESSGVQAHSIPQQRDATTPHPTKRQKKNKNAAKRRRSKQRR